jgi:hypothetical protein
MTHHETPHELHRIEQQLAALRPRADRPPWEQLMFEAGRAEGTRAERSRGRRLIAAVGCISAAILLGLLVQTVQLRRQLQVVVNERDGLHEQLAAPQSEQSDVQTASEPSEAELREIEQLARRAPWQPSSAGPGDENATHQADRFAYVSLRERWLQGDGWQGTAQSNDRTFGAAKDREMRREHQGTEELQIPASQDRRALEQQWFRAANSQYGDAS